MCALTVYGDRLHREKEINKQTNTHTHIHTRTENDVATLEDLDAKLSH